MIVEPRDDVVMESYTSEEVYLQCELSRSSGKVCWFKDGQVVEEGQNTQLVSEGPYRRLAIPSSCVEDSGEYVCETDGDSVFFQLTVRGKTGIENYRLAVRQYKHFVFTLKSISQVFIIYLSLFSKTPFYFEFCCCFVLKRYNSGNTLIIYFFILLLLF